MRVCGLAGVYKTAEPPEANKLWWFYLVPLSWSVLCAYPVDGEEAGDAHKYCTLVKFISLSFPHLRVRRYLDQVLGQDHECVRFRVLGSCTLYLVAAPPARKVSSDAQTLPRMPFAGYVGVCYLPSSLSDRLRL